MDIIWAAAKKLGHSQYFLPEETPIEDDHIEFLQAGVPSVDIIDLEYPDATSRFWHTRYDTIENVGASSLQAVGDVLIAALPALRVSSADAGRLARGQAVLLRGRDAPVMAGWVAVSSQGALVALAEVEKGELRPRRIFNLAR